VDADAGRRQVTPMTKVRFDPAQFEVSVDAPASLIDVTDEHPDSDVPFSCRSASCGTCRVEVLAGAEGLLKADEDELEVLQIFEDGPNVRLCCQLQLIKEVETLHLRVVDP
jgi:ferredoxin